MVRANHIYCVSVVGPEWKTQLTPPFGEYTHKIRWDTDGRSGWIIQHVEMNHAYMDDRLFRTRTTQKKSYWEAWRVDDNGNVFPRVFPTFHNDVFHNSAYPDKSNPAYKYRENSRCEWSIKGTVYWSDDRQFKEADWTSGIEDNTSAGYLRHRDTRPLMWLGPPLLTRLEGGRWNTFSRNSNGPALRFDHASI